MSWIIKVILTNLLMSIVLVGSCFAQEDLLSRVPQLQENARESALGPPICGIRVIELDTSRGKIRVTIQLSQPPVFENKISVTDLLTLLKARIESNRTGKENQMSGEVGDLMQIIFSVLRKSKDPDVIPVIGQLLDDRSERIVFLSSGALQVIAKSSKELQFEVEKVIFPKTAIELYKKRAIELPEWAKIKEDS
ncbi:MAG: hypothetical protein H0X72_11420 [Acidobacteria bacterium]|jgi:hypothetical protein|nr:hypothetical protein [Acidobacteriota bacterium]